PDTPGPPAGIDFHGGDHRSTRGGLEPKQSPAFISHSKMNQLLYRTIGAEAKTMARVIRGAPSPTISSTSANSPVERTRLACVRCGRYRSTLLHSDFRWAVPSSSGHTRYHGQ